VSPGLRAGTAAVVVYLAAVAPAAGQGRVREGRDLYAGACISCHGPNGEGVTAQGATRGAGGIMGLGPPLRGVGALAADFYLRTGYMPVRKASEQPRRRSSPFSERQLDALVAYVASLGGGPPVPHPQPGRGSVSRGLRLFTEHCAGCHQVVGAGGLVTGGLSPPLLAATPTQIAEAVRIGPYVMPRFSQRQLPDRDVDSIIRYIDYAKHPDDRGGWSLGHVGPITEGLFTWLVAAAALVAVSVAIGKRRS
jgi:ubiquinol-cytochrome c reductase cytochrome c subunit